MRLLRALGCGVLAGTVGTAAMDALWYRRSQREGSDQPFLEWETNAGVDSWKKAPAPGQAGQRILEGVLGQELPDEWARPTAIVFRRATGIVWGVQYGLAVAITRRRAGTSWTRRLGLSLAFGPVVWLSSYVVLPLLEVYRPIWEYDAGTLGKDLSAHLLYGAATSGAFAALGPGRP